MNALLSRVARGVADRAVEIGVVGALGAVTIAVTWWFAPLTVLTATWWCAVEVRLWRARRAVPVSSPRADRVAVGADTDRAVSPAERVSAGQQGAGRAGA